MQTAPLNWTSLFSASHRVEYKFVIDGIDYFAEDLKGTPQIRKPLMEQFSIGEFASASVILEVYPKGIISKAASVNAYCRLASLDGNTVTDWIPQGKFIITSRSDRNGIITLNCQDAAIKAGHTYTDRTAFTEWPVSMVDVVDEIASIMGVEVDARTVIQTGADYVVSYPNDDMLMSEVLRMIAAAHGGNWILTEAGKLRLVTYGVPGNDIPSVGGHYQRFAPLGKTVELSRVTLTDDAGNQFTVGDNTGDEVTAECFYATQDIVNTLDPRVNYNDGQGILRLTFGTFSKGLISLSDTEETRVTTGNGRIDISGSGVITGNLTYLPYTLEGAYIDPRTELGDFLQLDFRGKTYTVFVNSIDLKCTVGYSASLALKIKDGTDDEYPSIRAKDLKADRYVSTAHTYHGNRINRNEGFVSEYCVNDTPVARLIANSNVFSMQQLINGAWENRIFFDAIARKYKITGDVTVEGMITADVLRTSGGVEISGDNITTGTISAARLDLSGVEGAIASIRSDLEGLTTSVQEVEEVAVASVSVEYALSTSSSVAPSSGWSTTAPTWEAGKYMWQRTVTTYADSTPEVPHTSTSAPTCIQGAKGQDGSSGSDGYNTALVYLYKRSTTVPSVDWTASLTYDFAAKALTATPAGWSATFPEGTTPLYVTVATAYSQNTSDVILYTEWTVPVLLVENGEDGQPGTNGADGLNVATVFLYQRGAAAPAKPTGNVTYTFASGAVSGSLNGWSKTIPTTDGNPCYVIQATASNTAATDTIGKSEWSSPAVLVEDGTDGQDGVGITSVTVTYSSSASPSTIPSNWQTTIPSVPDGEYLWTRTVIDYTDPNKEDTVTYTYARQGEDGENGQAGTSVTVSSIQYQQGNSATTAPTGTWSNSVVAVDPGKYLWTKTTFSDGSSAYGVARQGVNGNDGATGYSTAIVYLYKRSATTISAIDWSNSLTYNFANKALASVPSGWSESVPSGTNPLYVTAATAYSNTGTDTIAASEWSSPVVLAKNGEDGSNGTNGTNGLNVATVFLYQRSASAPSKPTGNVTYSFSDGAISGSYGSWSATIPASNGNPCYVIQATASNTNSTDTIASSEWSSPVILVEDGADGSNGTNGANGYNAATIYLYQRAVSTPSKPSSVLTYTFSTNTLTGTLGNWSRTIPSGDNPLYVTAATAYANTDTDSIAANEWSSPVILAENGEDGAPGTNGTNGANGLNTATVFLYQRSRTLSYSVQAADLESGQWSYSTKADNPARARTKSLIPVYAGMKISYTNVTFDSYFGVLETPTSATYKQAIGWKTDASGTVDITVDGYLTFVIRNHADTSAAVDPSDFDGTVTVTTVSPTAPTSTLTYTFATGVLTGTLGNWSTTIPATDGNPCYAIQATAISSNTTDTIASSEWSTPAVLVEDGAPGTNGNDGAAGYSTAIVYLYKRSSTAISTIDWSNDLTYNFTNKALTSVPSGWSESVPSGTNPLYVTTATAYSNTGTDIIAASEWSAPVVLAENGSNGTNGLNAATVFLYQRYAPTQQDPTPAAPSSALTYTFSTGALSGTLGNWTQTIPASNGNPCFVIQATASSRNASVSIAASGWSSPVVLVEDGADGTNGTDGDDGVGISAIITEYLLVTGQTTPTGDEQGWTTTPPAWSSGKYIWTRSHIYWDNNTETYTTPECNNTVTDFGQKYSEVKQTADKIDWLVASGTTSANFTMTSRAISQVAQTLSLTATASEGTEVGSLSSESYASGIYRFSKTSDDYYTSSNAGVNNSVSYGKLTFNFAQETVVVLRCINRGESTYDFGIVSELDASLSISTTEDTTGVLHSFKGEVSEDPVDLTLVIPSGSHFVTFKYKKDGSQHNPGDYFKIKATTLPSPESTLTLKSGSTSLSSARITFAGMVTFNDLASAGSTVINGANITTGMISADRIDTSDLKVKTVYGTDSVMGGDVIVLQTDASAVSLGVNRGVPTPSVDTALSTYIYGQQVYISSPYTDRKNMYFDTFYGDIRAYDWSLFLKNFFLTSTYDNNDTAYIYYNGSHIYAVFNGSSHTIA